jgi:hypothetical protein
MYNPDRTNFQSVEYGAMISYQKVFVQLSPKFIG